MGNKANDFFIQSQEDMDKETSEVKHLLEELVKIEKRLEEIGFTISIKINP